MSRKELTAQREGFLAHKVSECKYPKGKLRNAWMYGFQEGQDFIKRVEKMTCPICYETFSHAPGCPNGVEEE